MRPMRLVLLYLALVFAICGLRAQAASDDCCPCAEKHTSAEEDEGTDCCLPGPHQCVCAVVSPAALPRLPEIEARSAPAALAPWVALPPSALHALPRPPPPTPPPIA